MWAVTHAHAHSLTALVQVVVVILGRDVALVVGAATVRAMQLPKVGDRFLTGLLISPFTAQNRICFKGVTACVDPSKTMR